MTELRAHNITVHAAGTPLVRDASFTLAPGTLVALIGPNGAGKTTLLRAALGLVKPTTGTATLDGDTVRTLTASQRARRVAYLPQSRPLAWPNTVRDVVALGRFAHGVTLGRLSGRDAEAVARAMAACDLTHLAQRKTDTLSGGELAGVHCARVFAAEAPLLVADEPVASLDPRHQFRVMDLIRRFVDGEDGPQSRKGSGKDSGGGALVVLHDIDLASRYADRVICMTQGQIVADGPRDAVITPARLADIYKIRARVDGARVQIDGPL